MAMLNNQMVKRMDICGFPRADTQPTITSTLFNFRGALASSCVTRLCLVFCCGRGMSKSWISATGSVGSIAAVSLRAVAVRCSPQRGHHHL
jgi:hypothetical protein